MSSWRQDFPNIAAGEQFAEIHPYVVIGYSVAIIVVYLFVLLPLYRSVSSSQLQSSFSSNLLYTGPGGALDNQLGSCMSQRESGPYSSCGSAEPFSSKKNTKLSSFEDQYGSIQSLHQKSNFDSMNLRNYSVRSRFIVGREPDAVMFAEQDGVDALQQEINSMVDGGDDGADAIMAHRSSDASYQQADAAAGQIAASATSQALTSTFAGQIPVEDAAAAASQAASSAGHVAATAAAETTAAAVSGQIDPATAPAVAAKATMIGRSRDRKRSGFASWGEDRLASALHD